MDTAGGMPTTPDLPRLPIGPTSIGGPRSARTSSGDTLLVTPSRGGNPAPVFTPGAAPIPRATQPVTDRPPGGVPYSPSGARGPNGRPPHQPDSEAVRLRAEIVRRRHRVDSLRVLLDSLRGKARPDTP
jgi:hypothetical protein